MINYKCIIIDDDAYAIEGLKKYIELIPTLVFFKSYTDPLQALLELMDAEEVDLILMDIDMPYISGIELSKILRKKKHVNSFSPPHIPSMVMMRFR